MLKSLFLFFLLYFWACTSQTRKDATQQQKASVQWEYLRLEYNDTIIQVSQHIDTLEVRLIKGGVYKFQIDKPQCDSLFYQANELLEYIKQPERFCTDYVGTLKIGIRYNSQIEKETSFASICNWRDLNMNTIKIDELLKKVFEAQ